MKALQRGLYVLLWTTVLGCAPEGTDEAEHGISRSRPLSQLDEAETLAVCRVNNGQNNIARELFAKMRETCEESVRHLAQSREDCAELANACLFSDDVNIVLRSTFQNPSCVRESGGLTEDAAQIMALFGQCDATVGALEECGRAVRAADAMQGIVGSVCNDATFRDDAIKGDHPLAIYDACGRDAPPQAGDNGVVGHSDCAAPLPGCVALAEACPSLYCDQVMLGRNRTNIHRETAFCTNLN